MPDPKQTVMESIQQLLRRKDIDVEIGLDSDVAALGLESLDLAELSAILEDELGKDPYSAGIVPRTVGEIIDWYNS